MQSFCKPSCFALMVVKDTSLGSLMATAQGMGLSIGHLFQTNYSLPQGWKKSLGESVKAVQAATPPLSFLLPQAGLAVSGTCLLNIG